jgi:hypothetical protein
MQRNGIQNIEATRLASGVVTELPGRALASSGKLFLLFLGVDSEGSSRRGDFREIQQGVYETEI